MATRSRTTTPSKPTTAKAKTATAKSATTVKAVTTVKPATKTKQVTPAKPVATAKSTAAVRSAATPKPATSAGQVETRPLDPVGRIPSFRLAGSDGKTWTEADLLGARTVLYFYPKDSTPGCTVEACDFRDNFARAQAAGIRVVGVSPDSLKSHASFIAKQGLTFPLLADTEQALAKALGVWVEKSMYGRKYMGIERSTFLIASDGTILRSWRQVKVPGHVAEVIAAALK